MMYIRTKDGCICEVVGFDKECIIPSTLIKVKSNYGKERITHCCKDDIINQSENLEELCDCIIILDNKADLSLPLVFNCYGSKAFYEHIMKRYKKEKGFIFYLGIWTSKGLIYVAKMDNEGKLVLI